MQETIIAEIVEARKKQDEKWGETDHHPLLWFSIIGEEYGKMLKHYNDFSLEKDPNLLQDMEDQAIQVAACCVAMCECLERVGKRGYMPE